jgi:hypothetical protein
MVGTEDLLSAEERGWRQLNDLIDPLGPEDFAIPGDGSDGWTVKDLMWHVARWSAEAAETLDRIRAGTYDGGHESWDSTEELNARWLDESRRMDLPSVKAEWYAMRKRMVEAFAALPDPNADAIEWFEETGPKHYADHLDDLRSWVDRLGGSAVETPGSAGEGP